MRVLVTGATGFVGRHLVRALLWGDHAVRAFGRDPQVCAALRGDGAEVVRGELRDAEAVAAACDGVDAVYHVGALSAPWGKRADFYAVNVTGTSHVLAGCRLHGVRRLIHVSSPSVVFSGRDVVNSDEAAPYPRRFLCGYSWSKKLAEDLVRGSGVPGVIVRPKAVFGPGDTSLLPRLADRARAGRLPQIGRGDNLVDLTYVDNVVEALLLALTADAPLGRTYTVTNGEPVRLWDTIGLVLRRLGLGIDLRRVPYWLAYVIAAGLEWKARLFGGEPTLTRYLAAILGRTQTYDISAARRDLGYRPVVSIAEGLERTLAAWTEWPSHAAEDAARGAGCPPPVPGNPRSRLIVG
jgi:nucleoside-diphosphate-sugar epimerase